MPYFHMTDFLARRRQFANDWSDEKHNQFMERLTMMASEHTIVGVSVSVNDEQFERVLPVEAQGFWREPYFFCVWGALQSLSIMERISRISLELAKPIWCLFDPRQKALEFAVRIFRVVKTQSEQPGTFGEMGFGEMWRTPEIQAADLLVYEGARHLIEKQHNPNAPMRASLQRLGRKQKLFMVEVTEESLRAYVELSRRARWLNIRISALVIRSSQPFSVWVNTYTTATSGGG